MTTYKFTPRENGRGRLGVPSEIAAHIPHEMRFTVELTAEGILYRPAGVPRKNVELPDWVTDAFEDAA